MGSFTILLVEDDFDVREALAETLRDEGYRVDCAVDGEQALDYLRGGGRPGLILLDLNMPRKDGREALQEIKGDPEFRRIPVVVFTTSRADTDIGRVYDLGANSFITKPVSFDSLVDVMKTLYRYWFEIVELPAKKS